MPEATDGDQRELILVFDGECAFCSRAIHFIAARDRERSFRFCASASQRGRALLDASGFPQGSPGSIVVIDGSRALTHSSAVIEIVRRLPLPWRVFAVGALVPRPIRDWLYGIVARHRRRLGGGACRAPNAAVRARMVE